ncbi:GNAT family N-acetyltransferase [Microbacteriaceae bacterium VKM Ac-2854]|nr:GNAT family N-acetyltransferase [Microbacteriaceae bacterium VKM Ac-2854]
MREARVRLRLPRTAQERESVAQWLGVSSRAAALSSDVRESVTVQLVESLAASGRLFVFADREDRAFGVGTWSVKGNPRNLEFAVVVGDPAQWRSGLGGEAALRLVDFLFMTYDANKVFLLTGAFNPYTLPALARSGFVLEARLREHYFLDGEFSDALVWSLLRAEHRRLLAETAGGALAYVPTVSDAEKESARLFLERYLADPLAARADLGADAGVAARG